MYLYELDISAVTMTTIEYIIVLRVNSSQLRSICFFHMTVKRIVFPTDKLKNRVLFHFSAIITIENHLRVLLLSCNGMI